MKNIIKKALVCILVAGICLSLSSCKYIDEMRKSHAVFVNEEKTQIMLNSNLYKEVDGRWIMDVQPLGEIGTVHLTEKDVPVLLSREKGEWCDSKLDDRLISYNECIEEENEYDDYKEHLYCREDYIEEFNRLKKEIALDSYCIEKFNENYEIVPTLLTKTQTEAIESVLKTYAVKMDYDTCYNLFEHSETVYKCNSDATWGTDFLLVHKSEEGDYYLEKFAEEYPQEDYSEEDEDFYDYNLIYQVPADKAHIFEDFFPKDDEVAFPSILDMLLLQ